VAAELFHADITKLKVTLCNFANVPKKPKSLNMAWKTEIKDILMSGPKKLGGVLKRCFKLFHIEAEF